MTTLTQETNYRSKEEPMSHRKKKAKNTLMSKEEGERQKFAAEREPLCSGSYVLKVFISSLKVKFWGRFQGKISIEYSSAFKACLFRVIVFTDWSR